MVTVAAILAAITAIATLAYKAFDYFKKDPAQKERDRIAKEKSDRDDTLSENHEAIKKAETTGDTSDIEKIISH